MTRRAPGVKPATASAVVALVCALAFWACQEAAPASPDPAGADAAADAPTSGGDLNFGSSDLGGAPTSDGVAPLDTGHDSSSADSAADTSGPADSGACPGSPGCACVDNSNCANALCIDDTGSATGKVCAQVCISACPDGYKCTPISSGAGDIVSVCVPKFVHLCAPCASAQDCQSLGGTGAACVSHGPAGNFCGTPCLGDADCPGGYACKAMTTLEGATVQQCTPLPEGGGTALGACKCSALAIAKKATTACFAPPKDGSGVSGKCTGTRSCSAVGLTPCSASAAAPESCNGKDDDCDGQTDEGACDDGLACTSDSCQGGAGCQHAVLNATPCDADGSVCTVGDTCDKGKCVAGKPLDCDDKNACTTDSCDLAKGCTQTVFEGLPCDADGSACTQGDVCKGGGCQKGQPVECDDGNPCTEDSCDSKTGQCQAPPDSDGVPCDDGTKCTTQDACQWGTCKGKPINCDDANPCTDDVCDAKTGCSHDKASGMACNDDNPCTVGDVCKDGGCVVGAAKACASSQPCVIGACSPTDGTCKFSDIADGTLCSDGSACTSNDGCKTATCKGNSISCDDSDPCTDDGCDPAAGCLSTLNAAPCSDGNACTMQDTCKVGICAGKALDCNDTNPCTDDSCNTKTGCINKANTTPCADGNTCTGQDTCQSGACKGLPGNPKVDCDDGNACTTEGCDPSEGCLSLPNQANCEDGNA